MHRDDVMDYFVIRLILCNGKALIMNPFGSLNTNDSCWPIILFIYNLSLGLCMKSGVVKVGHQPTRK